MKKNNFKNVIIFSFLGLGDFVWATSAISLIKQYDKNIIVTLISFDSYIQLIDYKLINDTIPISYKLFNYKHKFVRYIYKLYWFIKTFFKFYKRDTIIFLDISKWLAFCSKYIYKIKNIIGPNNFNYGQNIENKSTRYYTQVITLPSDRDRTHCMMAYQLIIRKIFPTYNLALPKLKDTSFFKELIENNFLTNIKKYKIALCLAGNAINRIWDINNYEILIKNIINYLKGNVSFLVVGSGKKQLDKAEELILRLGKNNIINLVNKTNLLKLKELLKNMDLLISVDTGIVHIASESMINMVCLYGSSFPERSGAVNPNATILCTYEKCSPCNDGKLLKNKICDNPKCMNNILPEMVFEKVKEILK